MVSSGHSERAFFKRQIAYQGPVSILYGDQDRLVPKSHLKGMRSAFPQARLTILEGRGHHPTRECPEDLLHFIEQTSFKARKARNQKRASGHRQRLKSQPSGHLGTLLEA